MPDPLVATDLALERGGRRLFEGLAFRVEAGGALCLVGPNGSGKSSLLRLLAGLLDPAAGRVTGGGVRAYMGHEVALKPTRPLGAELGFWAGLDDGGARLASAMAAMNVAGVAGVPCRHLSSGQRRRASLARVLAAGADCWLLDEPAQGLDAASLGALAAAMAAHRAGGGMVVAAVHGDIGLAAPQTLALG
ncbi:cytochrome C biogenesis protein CcmA [alpha proteobacterium AAP81b]|nr:cytochrome C biogenesis protein CcmA [alpha proteobacterium AAP81b]